MGLKNGGRRNGWTALLLATMLALLSLSALARTALELLPYDQPVSLQKSGDAWIDDSGNRLIGNLMADPAIAWSPTSQDKVYPLTTGRNLWIRFTIAPAPNTERWYLEIPYPSVDRVTLYQQGTFGQWSQLIAGDRLPVAAWPVPHRHPLLPIEMSAEVPMSYVLKIENAHSFGAPLQFVSERYLSRTEQRTSLVLGIYFGLAGLAAVLGVISAVSLRDGAYALYTLTVVAMALAQAAMTGIGGLHLWPTHAVWNDLASLVLPVLTVPCVLMFSASVVSLRERSRTLYWLLVTLSALGVVVAAQLFFIEPSQRFRLMVVYVVAAIACGVMAIAWARRLGDRFGVWLLAGGIPVMIGAAFPLARITGLIPGSFWTLHGMQVGIAIELPILLVMLLVRSQERREHTRRMQGMDRVDPATGLVNAQVFTQRLSRMIARSQRLKHQSALLLIDIVNTEQIRRDFDRKSAEEMPLYLAGRLLSGAREIDSVARLSDQRFGMLMEGPVAPGDAALVGQRVVAMCLRPFDNKPEAWVAQVRVAQALVPLDGDDPASLLARLDAVMATVPKDSKRAVFSLA